MRSRIFTFCCALLLLGQLARAQSSTNVTIAVQPMPTLTACSGQGTFTVRVSNLSGAAINNLVFRDSMPVGIAYVAGSASGTGVTFGSTIAANIITLNIATIPSSGFVDVSFAEAANCSVSTTATSIFNTYRVNWGTFFTAATVTGNYPIAFPSLSITPTNITANPSCNSTFVRQIQICNGGLGAVDSLVFNDVESNSSLNIVNFNYGTVTGKGTNIAKTVLHAADFIAAGFPSGQLGSSQCITITDTLKVVGSTSPITGSLSAFWGCQATNCAASTGGNLYTVTTTINSASSAPALTRILYTPQPADSFGMIYGRVRTYREVVKNNSLATATGANLYEVASGVNYFDTASILISVKGGAFFHPINYSHVNAANGNPNGSMNNILAPATYTGQFAWNDIALPLGDLDPGDSIVFTYTIRTIGGVTRVSDAAAYPGGGPLCLSYGYYDGPAISCSMSAQLTWNGCPAGSYSVCNNNYAATLYNGNGNATPGPEPEAYTRLYLARFRSFTFYDSTIANRCAYFDGDTVKVLMTAGVMDMPMYNAKSKFSIKIKTNGGVSWDGNLSRAFGRLTSWSANPWQAYKVVDSTAYDSTIRVYFNRSNIPAQFLSTLAGNQYNSYQGGGFSLSIGFINRCPGPAQKRIYMTRIYDIDTTNSEPSIEAGPTTFPTPYTWNSICTGGCTDGVSVLSYIHARTTFGQPDNNNDGYPDATGSLNMNIVNTKLITWGDTLQTKYRMVVHTTQAGGVPYFYINSSFGYSPTSTAVTFNAILKKTLPTVTVTRPGVGVFTGVGTSVPVSTNASYVTNLSLAGTGGLTIPTITSYQEGDTLDVIENLVYYNVNGNSIGGPLTFSFLHVPYTALVTNPTIAQQFKCDSVVCNVQGIDMGYTRSATASSGAVCADTTIMNYSLSTQIANSGCGTNYFPGESRSVLTPTFMKMVVPVSGPWSVTSIYYSQTQNVLVGCSAVVTNQLMPASLYSMVGDTLMLDIKKISLYFGKDVLVNDLYSVPAFQFHIKYTEQPTDSGCVKDHSFPQAAFTTPLRYETSRPVDSSAIKNVVTNATSGFYGGNGGATFLNWPGNNGNGITLYAGSTATVTNPVVVVPIQYNKNNPNGNDFLAIPNTPGITVDSVINKATGVKVPTVAGSAIWNVSSLASGSSTNFDVYTTVSLCSPSSLKIYADRMPCNGIPATWASYSCQRFSNSATYTYTTFAGELQMTDSLYTTSKNICTADTVQFKVVNSQTQNAFGVKVSFTLPTGMSLIPGQTQLKYGNGSFVTVGDPTLTAGVYTFTQATTDTLRNVGQNPNNTMIVRVGVSTGCGFVSGSQVTSSIAGNVACGNISSLFNNNPQPLSIIGAPALTYFTSPKISVSQVGNCTGGGTYNYRIGMKTSGAATGSSDSVRVILPGVYGFAAYSTTFAGNKNAPTTQPNIVTLPNGNLQLSWAIPAGVVGGDSIVYTFQYNEANLSNKCGIAPTRMTTVGTFIYGSVFCATTNTNCAIGISNGADTFAMQSLKPSLATAVTSINFNKGSQGPSYLTIVGTITNSGTADLTPGTNMIMETFMDLDNSGTINAGDYAFKPYTYLGGLAMGASISYTYKDTLPTPQTCPSCSGKMLMRFSNNPTKPTGATQCLCDTASTQALTASVVLPLNLGTFSASVVGCNQAKLTWNTLVESPVGSSFEIQASTDGTTFTKVATVKADGIVTGSSYTKTVDLAQGTTYYRILLADNGTYTFSTTITARSNCFGFGTSIAAYPNPFRNAITVAGAPGGSVIKLLDITGKIILEQKASGSGNDILPNVILSQGIYLLKIQDGSGVITTLKMKKD